MNFNKIIIVTIFAVYSTIIQAQDSDNFFYTGHYETAIAEWKASPTKDIKTWIGIAKAYRYLGLPDKALTILTTALPKQNPVSHAMLLNELSQLHLSQSKIKSAKQAIETAVKIIRPLNNQLLLADILRQLGNV